MDPIHVGLAVVSLVFVGAATGVLVRAAVGRPVALVWLLAALLVYCAAVVVMFRISAAG